MSYLTAVIIMLVILVAIAGVFWGVPMLKREKPSKGGSLVAAPPPPPGSAGSYDPKTSEMAFIAASAPLPLDQDFGPQSTAAATRSAGGFAGGRAEHHGGWRNHLDASPSLEWYGPGGQPESPLAPMRASVDGFSGSRKERYGEPPGMIRAVHQDELGFRGWADMPGDYEGSSASAISAYMQRSA